MRTFYPGRPGFVADWDSVTRDTGHTIDWSKVTGNYRVTPGQIVTLTAAVAAAAVSMTVAPLDADIKAGQLLYFGQASENVRVTTDAAAGATTLAIDPAPSAIESGDQAVIEGTGPKMLRAGTRVGDTGGTNGAVYPRSATNPAIAILATDAVEPAETGEGGHLNRGSVGVILGGVIYENLLPGATGTPAVIAAAEKTELQTAGVGTGFAFKQYRDSTV